MITSILLAFGPDSRVDFVFRLRGIPHCGIHRQLLGFDAVFIQGFDNVFGTRFGVRMARFTFQQYELNLTVFVQTGVFSISSPCLMPDSLESVPT